MADMLRGRINRWHYVLLLRNLYPIYLLLDEALHPNQLPAWQAFPFDALQRARAIDDDLRVIHGIDWQRLPLVDSAIAYVRHLDGLRRRAPLMLIAHAYLRHLGDLSGGQILRDCLGRRLALSPPHGLSFYDFGDGERVGALANRYRAALDELQIDEATTRAIVAEAASGYQAHERIFVELAASPIPDGAAVS